MATELRVSRSKTLARERSTAQMRIFVLAALALMPTSTAVLAQPLSSEPPVMLMAQACHPSYEGECVPITSDADCASGSGNGPAYVYGRVRVVGPDEYGLDRDGDGIACER